ncbi:MAG: hypothetical protein K2J73_04360, partial [Oscillospiraceae bacterium]|nr:hypothetical protein [Oscillospiraceae bacterium]
MSYKKFFAVFFIIVFAVTAALPAVSASAITVKSDWLEYNYSRQVFYSKPYIFEIGWNISDKTAKSLGSKKVALSDKTSMTVWYEDSLKSDMSEKDITAALADVLNRIKADHPKLAKPVVLKIKDTGDASPEKLVKQYFKDGDIAYYAAVLPSADRKTRSAYLKKAYDGDDAAFFSVSLDALSNVGITEKYLAKAYGDENIALFSICFNRLEDVLSDKKFDALINTYAEKAYADGRIDFFAVISGEMEDDVLDAWYNRASRDGKAAFKSICDYDDDWDWDDDWDDDWDWTEVPQEYADFGVTYKDGHYYYNGELVRYFVDVHRITSESRYATVQSNPNGKVSIEI